MGRIVDEASLARAKRAKHLAERARTDEATREGRRRRFLEYSRESAERVLQTLREVTVEAAGKGTSKKSIYAISCEMLTRKPKEKLFGEGLSTGCLPDYALRVFKYCKAEGLRPVLKLELYWVCEQRGLRPGLPSEDAWRNQGGPPFRGSSSEAVVIEVNF